VGIVAGALCGTTIAQPAGATAGAVAAKKRATKSCKHKRHRRHGKRHCRKQPPPRCVAGHGDLRVICLPPSPPPKPIPVPLPVPVPCLENDPLIICDPPPCPPPCPPPGIHCPLPPVALYYPCV
jgi:hypothetical protein